MDFDVINTSPITEALRRAVYQLNDPRLIKVLIGSLLLALVATGPFLLVFVIIAAILEWVLPASLNLPWLGQVSFLGVFTTGLVSKTSWVFWTYVMSPVAVAIVGIFLEQIVDAVEAKHYPNLPPVQRRPFFQTVAYSLRFLMMMLGVSLTALIVSFFSGIFAPIVFILANGYLIGREYYETVALRRNPVQAAQLLTRHHLPTLWLTGAALALLLGVPIVNLFVPLVGVAAFTHLYHRLDQR